MITVMNLATEQKVLYFDTVTPKEAVVCAYAQYSKKDWNTWMYDEMYNHLVEEGQYTFLCGDWSAFKDGREFQDKTLILLGDK